MKFIGPLTPWKVTIAGLATMVATVFGGGVYAGREFYGMKAEIASLRKEVWTRNDMEIWRLKLQIANPTVVTPIVTVSTKDQNESGSTGS